MKFGTEARIGLVVILAFGALVFMSVRLGSLQFDADQYYQLEFPFANVGGLNSGALVKMAGVPVGKVADIRLEDGQVIVEASIHNDHQIARSARAQIQTEGVLGEKYIEVEYLPEVREMQPGERSASLHGQGSSRDLMASLGTIAGDLEQITGALKQSLGNPQTNANLNLMLEELASMSQALNAAVLDNRARLDASMEHLRGFTAAMQRLAQDNEQQINALVANLHRVSESLAAGVPGTMQSAQGAAHSAQRAFDGLDDMVDENRPAIAEASHNLAMLSGRLNQASEDVQQIASKINRGDGTLSQLVNSSELHDQLVGAARGISDLTGKVEQFRTDVRMSTEFLTRHSESRGRAAVRITPQQAGRYYELAVVSTPFGQDARTLTERRVFDAQGAQTDYQMIVEDENDYSFEFDALFGFVPRDDLELRVGLIETQAGVGMRYRPPLDERWLELGLDAWDFAPRTADDKNDATHLKLHADMSLNRYFAIRAGWDDPLNPRWQSPFLGVRFEFTDENLKYLLGTLPMPGG